MVIGSHWIILNLGTRSFVKGPVTDFAAPVQGSLCFFGEMESTFAASFNNETNAYVFKARTCGACGLLQLMAHKG